jgi:polyisoprenyl-teichoic acid--peptidoglycan teichoic acid transferase
MTWRDPPSPPKSSPAQPGYSRASDPLQHFQAVPINRPTQKNRRRACTCGCFPLLAIAVVLLAAYFLTPGTVRLLLLGIDRAPEGTALGRSDTMILISISPLKPDVHMLSIPRDLWVSIPGVGENRINTAHYFAEIAEEGSGPQAAAETVQENFGVPVEYTLRVRFDGFKAVVTAMGGVNLDLPEPMAGYPAGKVSLDGDQALAFVRDRKGTDDFFRMDHTRFLVLGAAKHLMNPINWWRVPAVGAAVLQVVDTDIPVILWPRLGLAVGRAVLGGSLDARSLDRSMVLPFTTSDGAQVLGPNWDVINPVLMEMFGF